MEREALENSKLAAERGLGQERSLRVAAEKAAVEAKEAAAVVRCAVRACQAGLELCHVLVAGAPGCDAVRRLSGQDSQLPGHSCSEHRVLAEKRPASGDCRRPYEPRTEERGTPDYRLT